MEVKINRVNVVNEVLKHLEENILSGVWLPGQKIDTEISLSKKLNVSRASIHSAIQQLTAIGVLESFQGKGTYVKSISTIELQNRLNTLTRGVSLRTMMEFRIILEGGICKALASNISEDTLRELYHCVEELSKNRDNPQSTKYWDLHFHRTLYIASQNELIVQSLQVICDELERSHMEHYNAKTIDMTIKYHKTIADCLKAGNGAEARQNMIFHLASTPCDPPFDLESLETIEASLFNWND